MVEREKGRGTLGTFTGVFTPSILTILGIILFMRLDYVVGNAGLRSALMIIALSNVISLLTTFSLSAIATNMKVKGGGDYYLISRTLGVEFGGAIGIVLYLAQSVSIAFYCIGFGEAAASMLPGAAEYLPRLIAMAAAAFLLVFAWLGADWASRLQYVVMVALVASLASFFIGGLGEWDGEMLVHNWTVEPGGDGFWILFAIFFPAVTGFTQGVSMSGDLKDPGRSLPRGTFLAVGISILVYFGAAVVFAAGMPASDLGRESMAMKRLALVDWLISAGVIAATLSSAMASFLGAPRILQSMARDRIFPILMPFAKGAGPTENPRRGVLLSAGIAFAAIGLGKLNLIAPLVSMFFLISYGLLNYATYFEAKAASPSFRPRFRWFDARLSGLGALCCLGVMLAIDLAAGAVAISVLAAIYQYLKRTAGPARWADSRRSYHFQLLKQHLFAIGNEPEHPRNWRPRILVFSKDSVRRERLLRFASWLEGRSGLITAVTIVEDEGARTSKLRREKEAELLDDLQAHEIDAFGLVVSAPDLFDGARIVIQAHGIGPVRANTVLLNWIEERPAGKSVSSEKSLGRHMQAAIRLGCNVVILDSDKKEWDSVRELPPRERRIDIWWCNDDATNRFTLLLAYLMTRSDEWNDASIRVLAFGTGADEDRGAAERLDQVLEEARIEAQSEIVPEPSPDEIVARSADAAMVYLPLCIRSYQPVDPFGQRLDDLFTRLPVVAMVLAAEDIPLDAEPEEGDAGEAAALQDAAEDADRKARDAEEEAAKVSQAAMEKKSDLRAAVEKGDAARRTELEKELHDLNQEAEKAVRRAAKARAKAEETARSAESSNQEKRTS